MSGEKGKDPSFPWKNKWGGGKEPKIILNLTYETVQGQFRGLYPKIDEIEEGD